MAMSQFAPTGVSVPEGFEELLEAVTREILRAQPADIVTFAAEYFKRKVTLRDDGYNPIVESLSKTIPSSIVISLKHSTSQLEDGRDSISGSGKESPFLNDDVSIPGDINSALSPGDTNIVLSPGETNIALSPGDTNIVLSPGNTNITLSPHSDAASHSPDTNVTETLLLDRDPNPDLDPNPDPDLDPDHAGSSSPDPFTGFSTPNLNSDPETVSPPPDTNSAPLPPPDTNSPPLPPPDATSPPPETNHADFNKNEIPSDNLDQELNEMDEEKADFNKNEIPSDDLDQELNKMDEEKEKPTEM